MGYVRELWLVWCWKRGGPWRLYSIEPCRANAKLTRDLLIDQRRAFAVKLQRTPSILVGPGRRLRCQPPGTSGRAGV